MQDAINKCHCRNMIMIYNPSQHMRQMRRLVFADDAGSFADERRDGRVNISRLRSSAFNLIIPLLMSFHVLNLIKALRHNKKSLKLMF